VVVRVYPHPKYVNGPTNRDMLEKELGHVQNAVILMDAKGDINEFRMMLYKAEKFEEIDTYLHHQDLAE